MGTPIARRLLRRRRARASPTSARVRPHYPSGGLEALIFFLVLAACVFACWRDVARRAHVRLLMPAWHRPSSSSARASRGAPRPPRCATRGSTGGSSSSAPRTSCPTSGRRCRRATCEGETPREKLLVRPEAFWAEHERRARCSARPAARIDPAAREVELADGRRLAYDKLLVATGGRNRRLPVPGRRASRRARPADDRRLRADPARPPATAGALSSSAWASSAPRWRRPSGSSGSTWSAVEPFASRSSARSGRRSAGRSPSSTASTASWRCYGEGVDAFEGDARVERVVTSSGGRRIECDLAVVGVGIEPAVDVVAGSGVEVDNGILVDELCRTNVEGIFAAGDVANHLHPLFGRRIRVEHWRNAIEHGAAAARSMLGKGVPYAEVHWFWSDQYDANIQYAGHHRAWDELVVRGSSLTSAVRRLLPRRRARRRCRRRRLRPRPATAQALIRARSRSSLRSCATPRSTCGRSCRPSR